MKLAETSVCFEVYKLYRFIERSSLPAVLVQTQCVLKIIQRRPAMNYHEVTAIFERWHTSQVESPFSKFNSGPPAEFRPQLTLGGSRHDPPAAVCRTLLTIPIETKSLGKMLGNYANYPSKKT